MKKSKFLKCVSLLLAVIMLVGCTPKKDPTANPGGNDNVDTNIELLDEANAVGVMPYCIIYPDEASDRYKDAADNMYSKIKEVCGTIISSASDYIGRGEEIPADAAEIVIGKTNRKDFSALRYSDFSIRREGKRIYICGGSGASTERAVSFFVNNYLCAKGFLIPDTGYYNVTGKYSLEKLTVDGTDISEFKIYTDNKKNSYSIQESIGNIIGWEIPVVTRKSSGEHYILLEEGLKNIYGFEITVGNGNLTICSNKYTVEEAISYLKEKYFSSLNGSEVNMTSADSIKVYADQKQEYVDTENMIADIRDEAKALKLTQEVMDNSVVSRGNRVRLANVIKKAKMGASVTVGLIGGSITQGSGGGGNGYANLLKAWWESEFPDSELTFINAGIGATDSMMGVHRADTDLLEQEPDLVIVDFSVNDSDNDFFKETYESLIRKILSQKNSPAVMLMFFFNQSGGSVQGRHSEIGFNYSLPMISYKDALWPEGGDKLYEWTEISNDTVHPNTTGHAIAAELIINYIQNVEKNVDLIAESTTTKLPKSVTKARFEDSELLTNKTLTPTSLGSFVNNTSTNMQFNNGWTTKGGTEPIEFNLYDVNSVYVLYFRDKSGASGKADVLINDKVVTTLDADASKSWGSYAQFAEIIPCQDDKANYKLSIKLNDNSANKSFSILGIMVSYRTNISVVPDEETLEAWYEYVDEKLAAANLSDTEKEKSFIFITDTHWDTSSAGDPTLTATSYVMKYASEALGGATVIHGGDLFGGYNKKKGEDYPYNNVNYYRETALNLVENYMTNELYANFGTNFLYAWGNHCSNIIGYRNVVNESSANYDPTLTKEEAAQRYLISDEDMYNSTVGLLGDTVVYDEEGIAEFTKIMKDMGYSASEIKEAEYMMRMHYYRDDAESKIRYVVLDTGGCGRTQISAMNLWYSVYICTEYKWLANVLNGTPDGYDVVVVGHELADLKEYHAYDKDAENVLTDSVYARAVFDILTAFKNGEKITVSASKYGYAMGRSELAEAVIKAFELKDFDFGEAHKGNIITLSGHEHVDLAWYVNNGSNGVATDVMFGSTESAKEGAILAIGTGVASPYSTNPLHQRNDGIEMSKTGFDSMRFDIVTFRDDGTILLTRIGAGQDRTFEY